MRTNRITFEVIDIVKKAGAYGAETLPPHHQSHMSAPTTGWKSPVPYLFGGLAAMLGLIAFALLILACSYWKLSGHMNSGENSGDNSGEEKVKETEMKVAEVYPNSFLVIVAGEERPTFLATPAVNSSWSGSCTYSCSCSSSSNSNNDHGNQLRTTTTSEEEKR